MIAFKTLVIFDLETTGLPYLEHGKTKITEMSLIACLVSHCQGENIPRVINKLTLALNPMKMISPGTSKINGLENELLEEMGTFDDNIVSLLNGFLGRLPQPLCIIAHNGNKFDFPILMKHLLKCRTKLIENIYCADSLLAFRLILQKPIYSKTTGIENVTDQCFLSKSGESTEFVAAKPTRRRSSIETTPERKSVPFNAHPVKLSMKFPRNKHSNVSRKLTFDGDIELIKCLSKCDSPPPNHENYNYKNVYESPESRGILKSHKLIDIYSYLHDGPTPHFHRSEDDCMALLSCINKCKDNFLEWLFHNSILLSDVNPLF